MPGSNTNPSLSRYAGLVKRTRRRCLGFGKEHTFWSGHESERFCAKCRAKQPRLGKREASPSPICASVAEYA